MTITRLGTLTCRVGEGPLWDPTEAALYFVDIVEQLIWRLDPPTGATRQWRTPAPVAAVALSANARMIAVLDDGFYDIDRASGACRLIARAPIDGQRTPFNDAKVDRQGRLVAVTSARGVDTAAAGIYRLAWERGRPRVDQIDSDYVLGNGPCWSPSGELFYCADSLRKLIHVYDYDPDTGCAVHRRLFADTTALGGIPDGATVDAAGRIWVALCGAGKIVCFEPDGRILRVIDMPTLWTASLTFGGTAFDRLFVTTLDPSVVGQAPDALAGCLFVIDELGARGLPEPLMSSID